MLSSLELLLSWLPILALTISSFLLLVYMSLTLSRNMTFSLVYNFALSSDNDEQFDNDPVARLWFALL